MASEQSGANSVCSGTWVDAGKRLGAGSSEGSACPSKRAYNGAVVQSLRAPCSAAGRIFYKDGRPGMQREFRAEVEVNFDGWRAVREACKNVPNGRGAG